MSFKYLEHEADVGLCVEAEKLPELFEEAARGLFSLVCEIKEVGKKDTVKISVEADTPEHLFVEFLNEIISLMGLKDMFFRSCRVESVDISSGHSNLKGILCGERIDAKRHKAKTEVKAATYSGLKFEKTASGYVAQCLLDL
ncbi:MAG: archease [Candidatus Omnitrophica bacterium]|nr:archease [Candidatus Omnitrophota bacterium]